MITVRSSRVGAFLSTILNPTGKRLGIVALCSGLATEYKGARIEFPQSVQFLLIDSANWRTTGIQLCCH